MENQPAKTECSCAAERRSVLWRRVARLYVYVHLLVVICTSVLGMEHVYSMRQVPSLIYVTLKGIATIGYITFLVSSVPMSIMMIEVWSRRDRGFVYLGICEMLVFAGHVISVLAACA